MNSSFPSALLHLHLCRLLETILCIEPLLQLASQAHPVHRTPSTAGLTGTSLHLLSLDFFICKMGGEEISEWFKQMSFDSRLLTISDLEVWLETVVSWVWIRPRHAVLALWPWAVCPYLSLPSLCVSLFLTFICFVGASCHSYT